MKAFHALHAGRAAGFLLAGGCSRKEADSRTTVAEASPTVAVRTVVVRAQETPTTVDVTGTIRPVQRAQLAAKVMGAIEELPIVLGQNVKTGDLLVKISADEISARVAQARSQLNTARRDLEREARLAEQGASTKESVKALEDRVTTSEAQLREAEVMLSYATIRAPFDGVIARRPVNAGDLAAPGVALLELEGTSQFEVEAGVPESMTPQMKVGMPITVEVPSSQVLFEGKIAELSSAADPQARTIPIKIAVPKDTAVRSGQFARVRVPAATRTSLRVPPAAVSRFGQMERVFVVGADSRVALRLVKTGRADDAGIEVVAGISDGDRVVIAPPVGLRDGQKVEIAP